MRHAALLLVALLGLAPPSPAPAQHSPPSSAARPAAEAAQFDFLVGEWELEVSPKASGLGGLLHGAPKLLGSWKAWRSWDGRGVDDELRVFDAAGNLLNLVHSLRVYDPTAKRWVVHALDVPRVRLSSSAGALDGAELRLQSLPGATSLDGKPQLTRTQFLEIGPDRFRLRQDRSADNGATWDEGVLNIVAKRVAKKAVR